MVNIIESVEPGMFPELKRIHIKSILFLFSLRHRMLMWQERKLLQSPYRIMQQGEIPQIEVFGVREYFISYSIQHDRFYL